jgi:hypothetical protein
MACAARLVKKWRQKGDMECETAAFEYFVGEITTYAASKENKGYDCAGLQATFPRLFPQVTDPDVLALAREIEEKQAEEQER